MVRYKLGRRQRDSYAEKRRNVKATSLSASSSSMQIDHRDTVVINGFLLFPPGSSHLKSFSATFLFSLIYLSTKAASSPSCTLSPAAVGGYVREQRSLKGFDQRALHSLKGPHLTSAYRSGYLVFFNSPLFR